MGTTVSYSECSQNKDLFLLYALRVTGFALPVARYVLRFTRCALRIALYALRFTRCVLRITFCAYVLRLTRYGSLCIVKQVSNTRANPFLTPLGSLPGLITHKALSVITQP